jgi:hypothetical protein
VNSVPVTAVTLEKTRGGQADKTGRQTEKKPPMRLRRTDGCVPANMEF